MSSFTIRPRLYWKLQLISWTLYGLFGGALAAIFGKFSVYIIPIEVWVTGTLLGLSHLFRNYVRRHGWVKLPIAALLPRLLVAHVLIGVVSQVIIGSLTVLMFLLVPPPGELKAMPWVQYIGYALNVFFTMWGWSAIYFGLHYLDGYKQAEIDKWKLAAAVQEAEMRSLKAQINPHFMFNGLNNIRALVLENPARARDMITHLSDLLRYSIQLNSTEKVALARELEIVRHYCELEAMQLEERLRYSLVADPAALEVQIPPMTLQLLVENAIKHGIASRPGGGEIHLSAQLSPDAAELLVTVRNTGRYQPRPGHEGVGLRNARERLQLLFGPAASLHIANDPQQADTVVAELCLPVTGFPATRPALTSASYEHTAG
ncbi:histidine kinase [Hymenobacter saemangeumensis]|uniref:Histidine kinase n=1 Tax=Hymenobacter saemangeumensis TaxID=1084522 RepID=A0ABP8HZA7_9BACT